MAVKSKKDRIAVIIDTLNEAASGDYSKKIDISPKNDELDSLAHAINKILKKTGKHLIGQKQTRSKLRASEKRYKNILDSMEESYFEVGLKGNLLFFNDTVIRDLGYTSKDLNGLNFQQLVDKENGAKVYEAFHRVFLAGESIKGFDWEILKKNGGKIDVESSVALLRDDKGRPRGFRGVVRDITKRKEADQELLRSEERYRTILDIMGDAYYELDLRGTYTFVNDTAYKIFGYRQNELIGMSYRDILTPQVAHNMQEAFSKIYHSGKPELLIDYEIIDKDGTVKIHRMNAALMRDTAGKPNGFRALAWDVTENKKAEEARRISEEKYRNILESMEEAYLEADLKGNFVFFNDSLSKMLGYSRAELANMNYRNCIEPETIPKIFQTFNEIYRTDKPKTFITHELITKDGSKKIIEMSVSLKRDRSGNPAGFQGVARDVTAKIKAELAIKESEERFRMIVENMHDTVWTMDFHLHYKYISPGSSIMTGFTEEEIRTIPLKEQITPESYALMEGIMTEAFALKSSGQPVDPKESRTFEVEAYHKDGGTIWIEINATFNRDENGKPLEIVIAGRNITERKKIHKEKEKLEEQLLHAQKMESVGRLAGGVAHDFNNMLNVILGYAELSKMRLTEDNPVMHDIVEIEKAASRSKDITSQLLAFSRKQIIAPKIVNLNEQITGIEKTIAHLIGEDISLFFHTQSDLWNIKIDPSQIEQILFNLIINARDAMPGGGKLTVETFNIQLDEGYCLTHAGFQSGQYVILTVSDNGHGIDTETLKHIFEPFFTTKETGKGTGLGLSTVYGIIKQNGGFINVYSEPGQGTTFKVYFRRTKEVKPVEEVEEEPITRASGTILLVEDDLPLREMTIEMLKTIGYSVLTVDNPIEAVSLCEKGDEHIDLVITDVVMPEMNGRELRDKLAVVRPDIKVLFMSGYTTNVIAHHGVLEKGVHFLQKPFSMKNLAQKISEVTAGK
jgi:two-component system, cell cycle sensor histidine kinase and response regulator CckA